MRDSLTVELFRQVAKSQKQEGFRQPPEVWQSVVNRYLALPGLRGFWPMSSVDYTAANRAVDLSGQVNHLTDNNGVEFGYDGLAPYAHFTAASLQYLSRADGGAGNWADILGTETYIEAAYRGLTVLGWFKLNTLGLVNNLIGKFGAGGNRSYLLQVNAANNARFFVSVDGTVLTNEIFDAHTIESGQWYFMAGRFDPSISVDVFVNNQYESNVAAIPASIHDSTAAFAIGSRASLIGYLDGYASMCAICCTYLSDAIILSLYEQTRAIYGV